MNEKKVLLGFLSVFILWTIFGAQFIVPAEAKVPVETRYFRVLAVEVYFDGEKMKSAQYLIEALLNYPNWNNSTDHYVSYIHLLSMYDYDDVDDVCKPYLSGKSTKANIRSETINFLGQAVPGEIVIFYYCGHGWPRRLVPDWPITDTELHTWLTSGGLPQAYVNVILDTCQAGSWIDDGTGGVLGPGRIVLAACESDQTAWGWGGSWAWFTYVGVISGFSHAIDSNGDGWISAEEDFEYAKPKTEAYAWEHDEHQTPTSYQGLCSGNVPLIQRNTTKPFPVCPLHIFADLVRRKAWSEHHHYVISKDEDAYQTLYSRVKNVGNVPVWVKVVFNVTEDDGTRIIRETRSTQIAPEESIDLLDNWEPSPGKYHVTTTCYHSTYYIPFWTAGEIVRTFRFIVTS